MQMMDLFHIERRIAAAKLRIYRAERAADFKFKIAIGISMFSLVISIARFCLWWWHA